MDRATDPFLWLLSAGEGVIETDDDGGDGLDALVSASVNRGCYLIDAIIGDAEGPLRYSEGLAPMAPR